MSQCTDEEAINNASNGARRPPGVLARTANLLIEKRKLGLLGAR